MNKCTDIGARKGRTIMIVVLIAAVLIVIGGADRKHITPFSTTFICNDVIYNAEDENGGAMVERTYQTVYFYNAAHQIVAVTDMSTEGEGTSRITGLSVRDGEIYIYESRLLSGSVYLDYESVQAYSHNGRWLREVECIEYDATDYVTGPQLTSGEYDAFSGNQDLSGMTLTYSVGFFILNCIFWLSLVLVAISLLLLMIDLLRSEHFGRHRTAILIGLTFLVTIGFYSLNIYQVIFDVYKNTVSTAANQVSILLESDYVDEINEIIATGDIEGYLNDEANKQTILERQSQFSQFLNANTSDYNYFATVFILDPNNDPDNLYAEGNNIYSYLDSRSLIDIGEKIDYSSIKNTYSVKQYGDVRVVQNGVNSSMFCLKILRNAEGTPIAVVRVVARLSNIIYAETQTIENALVNLSAIYILIYVIYILLGKYTKDIKRMLKRDKGDNSGRALDMSGIYMFVFQIANTIDDVMLVYAAKSLCTDMTAAMETSTIALIFFMLGLGQWIGTSMSGSVIRRFGERKTGAVSAIFGAVSMLFMAYAVASSRIHMLAAGKFLEGFFFSFLYVITGTIPFNTENPEERRNALNHSYVSAIGAEILTALVSGYIAEYIGYSVMYLLAVADCVLIFALTMLIFRHKDNHGKTKADMETIKSMWKHLNIFLKKPMLLFVVFYMIPYILVDGYQGYIFPMFTADVSISALMLANISVYGKAFTFLLNEPVRRFSVNVKPQIAMVLPMLLFSAGMMYFLISSNVYWAIMLYFAVVLVQRVADVGKTIYIADIAEYYHENVKLVQANFPMVETTEYLAQYPVLSAFMTAGVNLGSAIVGAVSVVMLGIFGLVCRKSKVD